MSLGMQEILPDGGLASFQNHVSKIADLGRYEDAYIVHAAEGETIVPMEVFDENPRLKAMLFAQMRGMGIDPERYIVGNELNSINPVTGQPEFFLKNIFKSAKKALKSIAPYAGTIAGIAGMGPWASAAIGAGVPLLMGEDTSAAIAGGLGGYGAGTAFGSRFGADPNYIWKDKIFQEGSMDALKANLGFGAKTSGEKLTAAQAEIAGGGAELGTSVSKLSDSQIDKLVKRGFEFKHGKLINPASADWAPWAKTASIFAPLAVSGRDEDDEPYDWGDPYAYWGGNFAAPGVSYTADGGIINAYDNGGDVHPGTGEITRTGIFAPGGTEGFVDRREELAGTAAKIGDTAQFVDRRAELAGMSGAMMQQAVQLAQAMKGTGRINDDDIRRAMEMLRTGDPEMIQSMMEKAARDKQMINEFRNIGEEGSPHDYTESKYADGGIAHLAGGSFPRMSGAIAGPGGPKDDMVPAMLSDGEFVMTADAVRNAGGGSRREGARRMYQLMNQLQGAA